MTALSLTILILSAVAGAIANAKQSGKLPASWVPWATVVGTFLAALCASLGQAGAMNASTLVAAIFFAVQAVFAAGAGVGLHLHFGMHKWKKAPSNDNAVAAAKPAA